MMNKIYILMSISEGKIDFPNYSQTDLHPTVFYYHSFEEAKNALEDTVHRVARTLTIVEFIQTK